MGGRGLRFLPGKARLGLGAGLALLALSGGARGGPQDGAPSGQELYARVLEAAASQELSDQELDTALLAVLEELPADPAELDDYGRAAAFLAELALHLHAGEGSDPALEEALGALPGAEGRSSMLCAFADAHVRSGRLEEAAAIVEFGLAHGPAPSIEPRLWHQRAEVARMRGRWDLAQESLDRMEASLPPAAGAGAARVHEYRSRLLQARAQNLLTLGLLDLCRAPAREAIEEADLSGEPSARVAARLLAFDRALMIGGAELEALEIAHAALADARLAPWHPLFRYAEGMAEIELAFEAVYARTDAEPAASRARAALAAALGAGLARTEELEAEIRLGDLERALGRFSEAGAHLGRARALAAELDPLRGPASSLVSLAMLDWRLAHEGGAEPEELARARGQLFDAERRFLAEWASTPQRPGGIGFLHLAWRAQLVGEVIEAELSVPGPDAAERAFERLLEAQAMGTLARERGLAVPSSGEVRSSLAGERRGLLVLLPARDRAHLFVVDRSAVTHHPIAVDRGTLKRRARELAAALQDRDEPDARALEVLGDHLLPSAVRERLRSWSGATTVGFDLLHGLSLGMLPSEDGRPWSERLALTTLPSVPLGLELARRERKGTRGGKDLVLVVANDPPAELDLPSFRFGPDERVRLVSPFDEERVEVLTGAAAARGALRKRGELLRGAAVVHFLTHGTGLARSEFSAALVLSRAAPASERILAAEDVAALQFGGLVVLSACGTGRGPPRAGDDRLVHLGGVFLDAGARCVVLARFPVEVGTTLALMGRFHARLAAGDPPAEALRSARAELAREEGLAVHRTAAFEVLGMGFEPVFER